MRSGDGIVIGCWLGWVLIVLGFWGLVIAALIKYVF